MSSAKELVYNIKNLKSGGKSSDDSSVSDMQWLYICDYYRATIIRQQQAQGQTTSPFIEQEIESDLTLCDFDDNLYQTIVIPKPIELHKRDLITHVGGDDERSYQRQSFSGYQWKQHSKYTKYLPYWFVKNDRVMIGNLGGNKHIVVRGVFERPIEVAKLGKDYNPMLPLEFNYPMSSNMIDSVTKMIADTEMKVLHMLPKDNLNDGNDLP